MNWQRQQQQLHLCLQAATTLNRDISMPLPAGPQSLTVCSPSRSKGSVDLPSFGRVGGGKYLASDTIGAGHNSAGPQLTELLGGEQRLFDSTSHPPHTRSAHAFSFSSRQVVGFH